MHESLGSPQMIRSLNERRVLELIFQQAPLSRAEISRITGLSKPTVSAAVKSLLDYGLVEEIGPGEAGPGRKPTLVRFAMTYRYVIGIQLGADRARLLLTDLQAQPAAERELDIRSMTDDPEQLLEAIRAECNQLLAQASVEWEQIGSVSVAIPGVVSATGEVSMLVSDLRGCEAALAREALRRRFPAPVVTDNDVNLAALAEYDAGQGHPDEVFAFLFLDSGIGAGIMIGGRLVRGLGGGAGELGDMRRPDGSRLEDLLSEQALLSRMQSSQPAGGDGPTQPADLDSGSSADPTQSRAQVSQAAADGPHAKAAGSRS
ncbi:ROK family transcriptional regulator, partial [Paenibacillus sp. 598K]|uniref:ROK family transcriptional regulator n=1 Tax=Paenibacillus sp. 598K TaxID=1117987 RepID=UPI0011CF648D